MSVWRALLFWRQTCMPNRMAPPASKKINVLLRPALCTPVVSSFILIHFNAAAAALVLSLIVRARTVHTQTISLLGRIDLMTTSSGHNRWGRGKRYIMRKGRQIMEDHRAISITLTSILECSSSSLFQKYPLEQAANLSELVSFPSPPSILSFHPLTFDPLLLIIATQQSYIWDHSVTHYWMMIILV